MLLITFCVSLLNCDAWLALSFWLDGSDDNGAFIFFKQKNKNEKRHVYGTKREREKRKNDKSQIECYMII